MGPVDDDTVFYMQSRGIPYREAQRLIVTGFFQEVLDRTHFHWDLKNETEGSYRAEVRSSRIIVPPEFAASSYLSAVEG